MKRRMIERTNERTIKQMNEWMNEWMDTRKREYTDEQRNESKKSKYKEWNTLHSWFYLIVPKLPYRVVGLEDFGCDTVNLLDLPQGSVIFLWPPLVGSSLVVNILHFFLYTLLKTNDTPSFPPEYHAPHPPHPPPRFSTPSPQPTNDVWSPRKKHDSTWHFKNSLLRHSLHVETHARKLTILGCLSPPKDFPNSISCANDSCSWSEQLPVIVMCRQRNR